MADSDYLIVGAGAAGAVLAARLTENPLITVVLAEAGRDLVPGREPADVMSLFPLSTFNGAYAWPGLEAHWLTAADSPALPFAQGRVVGGSSTIMGMWAVRGVPNDYDDWARAGANGWGWTDVLPFFRKLETDCDFDGPLHGQDGPLPIRRQPQPDWPPLAKAMQVAAARRGFAHIDDMNADFSDGHCVLPISRTATARASAGLCYLNPSVRNRRNLRLLSRTTIDRLLFDGHRVVGAGAHTEDGGRIELRARETIVTAGALQTPALLMRSGIGPGAALQSCGVPVVEDHPGIGANLQNHPLLPVLAFLTRAGREPTGDRPPASTYLRWSSDVPGSTPGDMGLYIRSYLLWHALGRRMAMLSPVLMRPASRGRVTLDRTNPAGSPVVEFNFLSDRRDLVRLIEALRFVSALSGSGELATVCGPAFQLLNANRLNRFNTLSPRNAFLAWLVTGCLDLWPAVGRTLFERLAEMRFIGTLGEDKTSLGDHIRSTIIGTNHVCGTCRMGGARDPTAVVDTNGRVHRITGLRVADASVMPNIPSGNTHLPTVMVAEKIADSMRTDAVNSSFAGAARGPQPATRPGAPQSGT